MKDIIVGILRAKPKQQFNTRQLAHHLELDSGEHKGLRSALKELVREGKIIMHQDERYSCRDENKILKGTIILKSEGYGFFIPDNKSKVDVFIPARHTNYAMNGDVVLVESVRSGKDGRFEGQVVQVLERVNEVIVGTVKKTGRQHSVESMDTGCPMTLHIPRKSLLTAVEGDMVAAKILQYPGAGVMAVGEIQQVIGNEENDETLTEAILLKHGVNRKFPSKAEDAVKEFDDEVIIEESESRFDLSELPMMTIDGITAKDFDDAVCVVKEGRSYVLYVSIADVSAYVKKGSDLDQEAYKRGTSTYLPDECIPMLPEKLSNGLCSLNPHVPRLTLTAEIHYNENFEFIKSHIYRSWIKSHKRATYQEVQAYLDGSKEVNFSEDIKESVNLMKLLSQKLMDQANKRGVLSFEMPEVEVVYDVHGKIQTIQKSQRVYAHKLIEVFMIAANVVVAQYFTSNGLPQMYRIHDQPDGAKVQQFMELATKLGLQNKLKGFNPTSFFKEIEGHAMESFLHMAFLRSLKQAKYQSENIGHYGLSLEDYSHFTSPIRRYPDLLVHRQIHSMVDHAKDGLLTLKKIDLKKGKRSKNYPVYSFEDLQVMGTHCSKRERESEVAEREILSTRKAIFIKSFINEKFFGLITRVTKNGMSIELDPYFVDGFLRVGELKDDYYVYNEKKISLEGRRTRQIYRVGDRIWVTVREVKLHSADINLALVEKKKKSVSKTLNQNKNKRSSKARRNAKRKR